MPWDFIFIALLGFVIGRYGESGIDGVRLFWHTRKYMREQKQKGHKT